MNPLKDIRCFLKDRPDIQFDESSDSISVLSSDFSGFDVSFREWKNGFIVSFGRWHEYLPKNAESVNVAINLFKFGLSDSCRLKTYRKGNIDFKCGLDYKNREPGQWIRVAKQSAIIYPLWEKEQVHFLQNAFITGDYYPDLFKGEDFEKVIKEISYTRKHVKYALTYSTIWLTLFLALNQFDFPKIFASIIMFSPAIFVTLLLPLLVI